MDEIDIKILNRIQSDFPVDAHPYCVLSKELGIPETEILRRINHLRSEKIIRRIGAVFDSGKLGFCSTLIGVKVSPDLIEEVAWKINDIPGVTHHYQREDAFNLWFTLTAKHHKLVDEVIKKVRGWHGVIDVLNLPSTKTFKIKVDFRIKEH